MKRNWPLKVLKILPLVILFIGVFGFVVMRLWNWLVPAVFGWHEITYWQALGILVLSKILFGGFRGGHGWGGHWRHRMMERWAQMTPEEREKFREGIRGGCGPFSPPSPEPKA